MSGAVVGSGDVEDGGDFAHYEAAFKHNGRLCWHWKITRGESRAWVDSGFTRTLRGATRAARGAIAWDIHHRQIIHTPGDEL